MTEDDEGWMDGEELIASVEAEMANWTVRCSVCGATWKGFKDKHNPGCTAVSETGDECQS